MPYGDLNYLGWIKAIFDRGIKGKQMFNNSIYPLAQQSKYKDIVLIDDIVFTSPCKYDSSNQHKMFPHYRVTCTIGLTCPDEWRLLYWSYYGRIQKRAQKKINFDFSIFFFIFFLTDLILSD